MKRVPLPGILVAALVAASSSSAIAQVSDLQKYRILQRLEMTESIRPMARGGHYDQAVAFLLERRDRYRRELGAGDPLAVEAAREAALLESGRGRFSAAIRILESTLADLEGAEGGRALQVDVGAELGAILLVTGSYRPALSRFEAALAEPRDEYPSRLPFEGMYESAMGLGDHARAREAIARHRAAKFRVVQVYDDERWARIAEARVLHREGRLDAALALLQRDSPVFIGVHSQIEIIAIQVDAGRLDDAEKRLAAMLRIEGSVLPAESFAWARIYDLQAQLHAARSRIPAAIVAGKLSVLAFQRASRSFDSTHADLRRAFLDERSGPYRRLANWLVQDGRLGEAQAVIDMLKVEELGQVLRRSPGASADGVDFTAAERAVVAPLLEAQERAAALGAELESIRLRSRHGASAEDDHRRAQIRTSLAQANRQFRSALESLLKEVAREDALRNQEIGEKNLLALKTLQGVLRDLGPGAVAVHYVSMPDRLHAIVTTPAAQVVRTAEVSSSDLGRRVFDLRRRLATPGASPVPAARALHDIVMRPIEADLRDAGATTLVLSLDGTLRYVPFAALHDGDDYLARRLAIVQLTPAGRVSLKDRPRADWSVGAFGVTRAVEGLDELPAVRFELESIVDRAGGGLPGEIRLDEKFDLAAVRAAIDRAIPVIHVASHFVFRPGAEDESFLLLGNGERMTLRDVKERDLDLNGVDLLALSACDTGLGGGLDENGREIEGLGALAQRQGAKAVMATLWKVADESTGYFMRGFYGAKSGEGLSKAAALQRVQVDMLDGKPTVTPKDRDYRHPFYWAPFVLMGNWL